MGTSGNAAFSPEYFQGHLPFRELPSVTGHVGRMTNLAAGAADVHLETVDRTLFEALDGSGIDMVVTKLYFTGGLGSRHSDGPSVIVTNCRPSVRTSATCAAIVTMQWSWRMFVATGARHTSTSSSGSS